MCRIVNFDAQPKFSIGKSKIRIISKITESDRVDQSVC